MTDMRPPRPAAFWPSHSLSVVVPAFNVRDRLGQTVERLLQALRVSVEDFEIFIVDDASSDGTGAEADSLAAREAHIKALHNPRRLGLGGCYRRGIAEASKSYFVYIPGDNTWPRRSFLELFGQLGKADVITSYPTTLRALPMVRRFALRAHTRTLNLLFQLRMRYYNGLTIYPLGFLRATKVTTQGFGFQAEILLRAIRAGLSHIEVAIPVDVRAATAIRVITPTNVLSVARSVPRLLWELRIGRRAPEAPPPRAPARGSAVTGPLRVLITGASSGIGAALVESLAKDGHRLFVCARRKELLDQVTRGGSLAIGHACDVSQEAEVQRLIESIAAETPYLDAVLNCAGSVGAIGPMASTDSRTWFEAISVNLFGPYLVNKHALRLLAGSPRPRIINFAGGGAFSPFKNYSAYATSKAAIVRLTECLAAELAEDGIAVNAVAPGFVATGWHDATLAAGADQAGGLHYNRTKAILEGQGVPISVPVDCVRFLLSDDALGLTGKTISANFDPWRTEAFRLRIQDIARSDLYTMRRVNIVNLPPGLLRSALGEASARSDEQ
jgi:NAD(P)-dependent dehydrogenase (short-subunit alcohol dehydrogenase family)